MQSTRHTYCFGDLAAYKKLYPAKSIPGKAVKNIQFNFKLQ